MLKINNKYVIAVNENVVQNSLWNVMWALEIRYMPSIYTHFCISQQFELTAVFPNQVYAKLFEANLKVTPKIEIIDANVIIPLLVVDYNLDNLNVQLQCVFDLKNGKSSVQETQEILFSGSS